MGSPLDLLLRLLLSNHRCCRRCCRQKKRSAGDWNLQRRRRRALALAIDSPSAAANAAVMRSSTIVGAPQAALSVHRPAHRVDGCLRVSWRRAALRVLQRLFPNYARQ